VLVRRERADLAGRQAGDERARQRELTCVLRLHLLQPRPDAVARCRHAGLVSLDRLDHHREPVIRLALLLQALDFRAQFRVDLVLVVLCHERLAWLSVESTRTSVGRPPAPRLIVYVWATAAVPDARSSAAYALIMP